MSILRQCCEQSITRQKRRHAVFCANCGRRLLLFSVAAKESMFFQISNLFGDQYAYDYGAVVACVEDYAVWGQKSLIDHDLVIRGKR